MGSAELVVLMIVVPLAVMFFAAWGVRPKKEVEFHASRLRQMSVIATAFRLPHDVLSERSANIDTALCQRLLEYYQLD